MQHGLIISSYGRQFIVEVAGQTYTAVTKSKKTDYVVGDIVQVTIINNQQAQINDLWGERHNLVYRSDHNRSKLIASNITQLLIVVSSKPAFSSYFLNACLLSSEANAIKPIIVLNKIDLPESSLLAQELEGLYVKQLGYSVITLNATKGCASLRQILLGQQNLLIGQSGVGKSTITNQLIPMANTRTGAISSTDERGCHTTTNAKLYHLDDDTTLIDCPGLQEFGLYHLEIDQLANYFPELRERIGQCRFRNCRHLNEPGCSIITAMQIGEIAPTRLSFLQNLTRSLMNKF
jgi:ribosome biogenesis GTPase